MISNGGEKQFFRKSPCRSGFVSVPAALESMHYVFQDKIDGGYYLTSKMYVLGRNTQLKNQLINILDEPVGTLCRRIGFSVTVAIRKGTQSVTIMRKDPQTGLTLSLIQTVGDTISLNTTAMGKVLTAFSGETENLLNRMDYVKLTKRSVTDRDEFAELLQEVRAQRLVYQYQRIQGTDDSEPGQHYHAASGLCAGVREAAAVTNEYIRQMRR